MPRLFPSIGRSSREHGRDAYAQYEGYDAAPEYYDYGYDDRGRESRQPSAWRRVLSRKPASGKRPHRREDQDLYLGRTHQATVVEYPDEHPSMRHAPSDDTESFHEIISRNDDPVPLVQRESSLTRLQQAFADHGTYPAASAATSAAHGTPLYDPLMRPMATVHETRHEPVLVNNVPREGIRPNIMQSAPYHHERRNRDREEIPRDQSQDEEYPVIVVVEHGKNGKKDKYYIIPGGAPVIFEDEDGNELTRVGDFSGNYRPRRPRPVIVQDQYGREICRAGFSDDKISIGSRSDDYCPTEDREYLSNRGNPHASSRVYAPMVTMMKTEAIGMIGFLMSMKEISDHHFSSHASRDREEHRRHRDTPNVVYIDPYNQRSTGACNVGVVPMIHWADLVLATTDTPSVLQDHMIAIMSLQMPSAGIIIGAIEQGKAFG
ncbi:hypothetical protein A0H81_08293 [Grifola frondosa]|uniref:Uncharacterized protein n=1 Tax=Grifola frondosa TaxID=5627 RepID=A0A1C7M5X1_GRIFR|nr:hypothetical protein A0H81_08293 [Grifola frondosa]